VTGGYVSLLWRMRLRAADVNTDAAIMRRTAKINLVRLRRYKCVRENLQRRLSYRSANLPWRLAAGGGIVRNSIQLMAGGWLKLHVAG